MPEETIIANGVKLKGGWVSGLGAAYFEQSEQKREYAQNGLPATDLVQLTPDQVALLQKPATYRAK